MVLSSSIVPSGTLRAVERSRRIRRLGTRGARPELTLGRDCISVVCWAPPWGWPTEAQGRVDLLQETDWS
eukprot:2979205-Pyramimonas_sp.AAC.1